MNRRSLLDTLRIQGDPKVSATYYREIEIEEDRERGRGEGGKDTYRDREPSISICIEEAFSIHFEYRIQGGPKVSATYYKEKEIEEREGKIKIEIILSYIISVISYT